MFSVLFLKSPSVKVDKKAEASPRGLVGCRVKVWWPMDKAYVFYPLDIHANNHIKKSICIWNIHLCCFLCKYAHMCVPMDYVPICIYKICEYLLFFISSGFIRESLPPIMLQQRNTRFVFCHIIVMHPRKFGILSSLLLSDHI